MESNLTSYLRLKKISIKQEQDDQPGDDDFSVNYFQWTPDATNLLLKLRFEEERHSKFEDRSFQRKELWDEIAAEMQRLGDHHVTADVCDLKYRNLLHTYKKNRNKELNGTDPENISWCYYEIFKQALKRNEDKTNNEETNPTVDTADNSKTDECTSNYPKRKKTNHKPEVMEIPVTPIVELRAPSARLSNKRYHSIIAQSLPQHSMSLIDSTPKTNAIDEPRSISRPTQANLSGFELEECRVFGETVGIQLSLIKSPQTRALAELKIQEILYAAKVSKLKE